MSDFVFKPLREITAEERARIENNFIHHPPFGTQEARYQAIRRTAKVLAVIMSENCPPSRELSLALTNLEQSVFWANAGIARNETREGELKE